MIDHPVETLRRGLIFVNDEGPMVPIRKWIAGRAFFPGGAGLFNATSATPLPPMPSHSIMFVGHNFDSEISYAESLARGEELTSSGTWKWLLKLLDDASLDPSRCFFTNAIMGLKPGREATGESPGFRDQRFRSRCAEYLRFQVWTIQPRAVVTLGLEAFQVFEEAIQPVGGPLRSVRWKEIDSAQRQFSPRMTLAETAFCFAALVHPSFRNSKVHRRSFAGKSGNAAEIELLSRAAAGLTNDLTSGDH